MKLIIDIPEEIYKSTFSSEVWNMRMAGFVCNAIQNGTPLDDVKAMIRAEQEKYSHPLEIERAIEILDNIGKAESRHEKNIQAYMRDFGVSREQAIKDLTVPESNLDDIPTNLDEIRDMSAEVLGQLLEDLTHYDDTDYEWKSNLMPLLPFEDWTDWLNRRAIYKKEV